MKSKKVASVVLRIVHSLLYLGAFVALLRIGPAPWSVAAEIDLFITLLLAIVLMHNTRELFTRSRLHRELAEAKSELAEAQDVLDDVWADRMTVRKVLDCTEQEIRRHLDTIENQREQIHALEHELSGIKAHI